MPLRRGRTRSASLFWAFIKSFCLVEDDHNRNPVFPLAHLTSYVSEGVEHPNALLSDDRDVSCLNCISYRHGHRERHVRDWLSFHFSLLHHPTA